jgi:hypothetical protein
LDGVPAFNQGGIAFASAPQDEDAFFMPNISKQMVLLISATDSATQFQPVSDVAE